jgi:hypothetical protein
MQNGYAIYGKQSAVFCDIMGIFIAAKMLNDYNDL